MGSVCANRGLEILTSALGQARAQVESNERQVHEGRLATIDVVEAQTQVANFELTVATAEQTLTIAENRLKSLMLASRGNALWNRPLVPADPTDRTIPQFTIDDADEDRPRSAPGAAARWTPRWRRMPSISGSIPIRRIRASTSWGLFACRACRDRGHDGRAPCSGHDPAVISRLNELSNRASLADVEPTVSAASTPLPPFLIGGWADSLANISSRRFPTATSSCRWTCRSAIGRRKRTSQEPDHADAIERQRQQLEQAIESEVRNALQAVRRRSSVCLPDRLLVATRRNSTTASVAGSIPVSALCFWCWNGRPRW